MGNLREIHIANELGRILEILHKITYNQHEQWKQGEKTVAAIDDLKTAVAGLGTSISAEIQAVSDKLSQIPVGGTSDVEIADVITSLSDLKAKVDAETSSLSAPAPVPTPAG